MRAQPQRAQLHGQRRWVELPNALEMEAATGRTALSGRTHRPHTQPTTQNNAHCPHRTTAHGKSPTRLERKSRVEGRRSHAPVEVELPTQLDTRRCQRTARHAKHPTDPSRFRTRSQTTFCDFTPRLGEGVKCKSGGFISVQQTETCLFCILVALQPPRKAFLFPGPRPISTQEKANVMRVGDPKPKILR